MTISETRFINAVPVSLSKAFGIMPYECEGKDLIWLLDTPGFGDSGGPEIDISNGLGTVRAIQKARSVRVCLVIPFDAFSVKGDTVNRLVRTLSLVIREYHAYLDCITAVYTHVNRDKRGTRQAWFRQALHEMYTQVWQYSVVCSIA